VTTKVDWLIAPDSFKGTYSALEVARALARGIDGAGTVEISPAADGGDGTLAVLLSALGGTTSAETVHDPLGRPITAAIGWIEERSMAIVESASASGLGLVAVAERDAERASTLGTGELVVAAVRAGASGVTLTAGGSASTDGGAGAIQAIEAGGGLRGAKLTVLADVATTFERAAEVFGPQKGADGAAVQRLTARLHGHAEALPRDPRGLPMSGAAGGLAGGLWARYGADIVAGAAWVLDAIGFDQRLRRARAVITGEGRLDTQTLEGKLLSEIVRRCQASGVPVHAIVGSCTLTGDELAKLSLASLAQASDERELQRAARELASDEHVA
jgi:glycerate 2-kinase